MQKVIKGRLDFFWDGFFYFFGFTDNPADSACKEILKESPSDKIKSDLRQVNSDYKKKYLDFRNEVMSIKY